MLNTILVVSVLTLISTLRGTRYCRALCKRLGILKTDEELKTEAWKMMLGLKKNGN